MTDDQVFYIVSGRARNGIITYRCPSAEWALKKARDFIKAEYADLSITAPDGRALCEADLVRLTGAEPAPTTKAIEAPQPA